MKEYPKYVWAGFDWSQAEVYALCVASKDEQLRKDLLSTDFHREVASSIYNIPPSEITKEQRELSKVITYRLLYTGLDLDLSKSALYSAGFDQTNADKAIERYRSRYPRLFDFVEEQLMSWYHSGGNIHYLLNQTKVCPVSEWLKDDLNKIRQDKQARVAINTIAQNSIGLLMKLCYNEMLSDSLIRNHTAQHIPIFDAFYFLAETSRLSEILRRANTILTPVLRNDDFEISMNGEWKISDKSLGELQHIELGYSDDVLPKTYDFY